MQEMRPRKLKDQGREGDSSFPGSTLLVQVSTRGKERARITVTAPNRQGRQHWEKEQG